MKYLNVLLFVSATALHVGAPARAPRSRRHIGAPLCSQQAPPPEDEQGPRNPEEVTKQFGLEAGIFSALRNRMSGGDGGGGNDGDGGADAQADAGAGGMATAGDLLKRYGGAYLLTSTSLALVSFSLCYLAVDNGIDVASLLSNIPGIEVGEQAEAVGTVGLAYAIHKAASPIRFPPTVALTPLVARKVFGKGQAAADQADAE